MSLKAELETWSEAIKAYDEDDFDKSLDLFSRISDTSKILFNMGMIYATLGEHEAAVDQFNNATRLDNYLAVGYFQCGVSNFLIGRYELAHKDFCDAFLYMRGNQDINYEQLGLKHKLHSAEILFNRGLALIYLGRPQEGLMDLDLASRDKAIAEHDVIDDAIREGGDGYTVFSVPVGVLYRPPENKVRNARAKDYMGRAKLVAASDSTDAYTTFTGVTRLQTQQENEVKVTRSLSAGASPVSREPPPGADLVRNKTTINVLPVPRYDSPVSAPASNLARANTTIIPTMQPLAPLARAPTLNRAGVGAGGAALPGRAVSLRRNPSTAPPPRAADSPPVPSKPVGARETEFFDDYLDAYAEDAPPLPPVAPVERVADWAAKNANPNVRSGSTTPANTTAPTRSLSYAPSSYSSAGGIRRKLTRRTTTRSRAPTTTYYEDEEGYVSGEVDSIEYELSKIRIRLHRSSEIRGMAIPSDMPFGEFVSRVADKFEIDEKRVKMGFTDEDGGRVSLRDESDWDLAVETARESARGRPEGKLDVWCEE